MTLFGSKQECVMLGIWAIQKVSDHTENRRVARSGYRYLKCDRIICSWNVSVFLMWYLSVHDVINNIIFTMVNINRLGADIMYHFQSKSLVVAGKAFEKTKIDLLECDIMWLSWDFWYVINVSFERTALLWV